MQFSPKFIKNTSHDELASERASAEASWRRDRDTTLDDKDLSDAALLDLVQTARSVKDIKTEKAMQAIADLRTGRIGLDTPVPSFAAFRAFLRSFLEKDVIDGWIYATAEDGSIYPELITSITYDDGYAQNGTNQPPFVTLKTMSHSLTRDGSYKTEFKPAAGSYTFRGADVSRKTIATALAAKGLKKETAELKVQYEATMRRHREVVSPGFAEQFVFTGIVTRFEGSDRQRSKVSFEGRKVIHDTQLDEFGADDNYVDSATGGDDGLGRVPAHPLVRVFDIVSSQVYWVSSTLLTPYVYDKSLADKLVLPETHRRILNALTKNWKLFTQDIIAGKSTGNCILCKGKPGLGKTLTAEVYAEITERPLLTVRCGSLGSSADEIKKNLDAIFARAQKYSAILMLNEIDVFVMRRGLDLRINAVVATFLESIEYFDGLIFCSTNRPDDIDDAFVQRCLVVIEYKPPTTDQAVRSWQILTEFFGVELAENEITKLVAAFPEIAMRDIKMLTATVLRMMEEGQTPTAADFIEYAPFRGLEPKAPATA